jgi:hypothetical protein
MPIMFLSSGDATLVDDIDYDLIDCRWYPQVTEWGTYARTHFGYEKKTLHRIIAERILGSPIPRNMVVDHINGDTLDNRRSNLRIVTQSQNLANMCKQKNKTSQYKGVSWNKVSRKWAAHIQISGKSKYLGLFNTEEAAHERYCEIGKEIYGEYFYDGKSER